MAVRFSRFISGEYLTRIENQVELYEMIKQGKVLVEKGYEKTVLAMARELFDEMIEALEAER